MPLPMMGSLYCSRGENAVVPGAVAQRTTFNRCKACCERAKQHGRSQPEGKLCGAFAGVVGGSLRFDNHVIHALLGIGLAQPGASSDNLRDISFIGSAEILIIPKTGRPQP